MRKIVYKTVVRGLPVVHDRSPGGPRRSVGGFGRKQHCKNCIRHWTNKNYTLTCLC